MKPPFNNPLTVAINQDDVILTPGANLTIIAAEGAFDPSTLGLVILFDNLESTSTVQLGI